ncbi:hypothetical protein IWQ49_000895 [Labrenzia sp. EL_126]|nr:hypothetical protein [Labrenzia sp. EL_126]
MQVDPSGRGKDETAIAINKKCKATIYLTMVKGLKGGYTDSTLELILRTVQKERINVIGIEPNFGDGLFARLLKGKAQETDPTTAKPFYDCGRIEDSAWVNTQKEARIIDTLEPALNQHRVVVDRSCILDDYHSTESDAYSLDEQQCNRFFYQMTRLTRDKGSLANDDRVDAVAGAVGYSTEKMAENPGVDFDQFHSGSSSGVSSITHLRH